MKSKHLLLMLLMALAVPLAALAQVERTVTINNGTDKECHVPVYGNLDLGDRSLSQFIMDKNVLQTMGLAGKEITKMTFYLANPVPASYQWTTPRYTYVTLAEVDASELDADGNVIQSEDMTDEQIVAHLYLDAQGETMEIAFSSPYTYSGEKNLLVQFEEQYQFYPSGYTPFGPYRKPVFYGVYKDGASGWNKVTYTGGHPTRLVKYNFVPKTTFTYLDEATWANTNRPQNVTATPFYDIGNNNSISYKIQLQWDAPANYTGNYQVLCVPRGTSTLDWSNPIATSNTFYTFEGLQKNTSYDLYVRAKLGYVYTSAAATASATTPFYPANLDEGDLVFDFNSRTMPNGLTLAGNATYLVRPYTDHTYSLNRLGYYNVGAGVGSFDWMGRQHYLETSPLTITLPDLKFTNASNGLMVDFDLIREEVYYDAGPAQVLVKLHDDNYNEDLFSATASTDESYYNGQHFTYRITNVDQSSSQHIYKLSFSSVDGGKGFTIDNIVVRKAPAIIPAYNLAASEITPNSATISWTDDNTNSHTFDLVYRQKGYSNDPNEWQHYVEGVSNPYTLTGLTPYTDYEVKVKTITSSAYEDSEILGFSTQCTPASVPYYEPFAGLTTLPTNWRINVPEYAEVVTEVGNGRLTLHNTVTEVTQNIYGYISTYTSYSQFGAYIILPYFNNLGSLQLSFKAGRTQGTMESLSVGVVADPNNYTDYTEIGIATLTDNANGEVYSYNLVNDAVQSGHIVIYFGKYESNLQSTWLDDFNVQQYAAPTGLVVSNVTNTSATLGWNAGAATQWEVRYGTDANSYGTPVAVTEPTYSITDLTACTDYVAQVRAKYGENLYSEWVSFDSFKTYYSTPVVVDQTHPYSFGFQYLSMVGTVLASEGGWQMINMGLYANNWMIGTKPGTIDGFSGTNYSLFISKNGSDYQYIHGEQNVIGSWTGWATTVYAARVFNLAPGSYQFSYDWRAKGIHDSDYFRVVLVPANTELAAGSSVPSGFSYNSLPEGWIALDGGEALNPISFDRGFDTYTTPESARINILEGGDYMMVFVWNNMSSRTIAVQNPPIAFDNVAINCTSLVYPPAVAALHDQVTDTEAPLALYVPEQGITPTSYEVQYEPAAAVNTYEGAPIATFNVTESPQTVTLTGLTPLTIYSARVRSVYTANGHSVYSDWQDCPSLFTTLCTPPTNLVVVGQTSSWANVMWTPVEMTLPSSQSIHYEYQLTTDQNNWDVPIISTNFGNNSCSQNFAPGTYYIRVRTYVEEYTGSALLRMGESDWTEPITFTIAPWTDPVSIFPLAYGFDEGLNRFADGITLGGDITLLNIVGYDDHELPIHGGVASTYTLAFGSDSPCESHLVLPPLNPSTSDALVGFWWYHDNAETNTNVGVVVEYSNDGSTWQSNNPKITRYADETGWAKYQQVVPAIGSNATYVRLRFVGPSSYRDWAYCFLDDLTVHTLKSEQPYISYVGCDANSATITLYDYAYENGYHSSAFEVQYREWRDPSETQEEWIDYPDFVNEEPYTFENELVVNGLQPATCYEFRARARVSYNNFDFAWSNYCEPVRQWTDCGTYIITPSYSYTEDFEELFNGTDCWTAGEGWTMQHEGGYDGSSYCAYSNGTTDVLLSPEINFSGCGNAILRFYKKTSGGVGSVYVYYGENFATRTLLQSFAVNSWAISEYSLSGFMNNGPIKIGFAAGNSNYGLYVDNIEIVADAYDKIFDGPANGQWSNANYWYPQGVPTANDNVMVKGSVYIGYADGSGTYTAYAKNIDFASNGFLSVYPGSVLAATKINHKSAANVDVADGGQLKVVQSSVATMRKRFIGYNDVNDDDHYYLFAPPVVWPTTNPSSFTTGEYDLYRFDGNQGGAEWRNYKTNNFVMQRGKGYLYAHAKPTTGTLNYTSVTLGGYVLPLGEETISDLNYGSNTDETPFYNWNLVGNPFPCNAYLVRNGVAVPFYKMNEAGDAIVPARAGTVIKPLEGVFVVAETEAESTVTFTTTEPALGDEPEAIMPSIPIHALVENQDALLMAVQTLALVQGWNWWAPMVQITAAQLNNALNGCLSQIMAKNEENVSGELIPGQMYKIQVNAAPENVSVMGVVTPANISIEEGTNWMGYTGETTTNIADGLIILLGESFTPNAGDKLISQDGGFAIYNATTETWQGTLTQLTQGQGYIYVSNPE
ncbi:MAG: fibronectin type III domain-containing protein [Bacteroidales bacterium]|nr:fibronectin type III domain-containing protein [Bacteroidales bacterium]